MEGQKSYRTQIVEPNISPVLLILIFAQIHTYVRTYVRMHTFINFDSFYVRTYMYQTMLLPKLKYLQVLYVVPVDMHTYTTCYIHTYVCTYVHTYIRTYRYVRAHVHTYVCVHVVTGWTTRYLAICTYVWRGLRT